MYLAAGGGGSGLEAIGTHPMAAARAKGSQAATEAIPAHNHLNGTVFIEKRNLIHIDKVRKPEQFGGFGEWVGFCFGKSCLLVRLSEE